VATDCLVAGSAIFIGATLRFGFDFELAQRITGPVLPRAAAFAIWLVVGLVSVGLYRARQRPRFTEICARVGLAVAIGGFADVLFFYFLPGLNTGRGILFIAMVVCGLVLPPMRFFMYRFFEVGPVRRRVLVIGSGHAASRIAALRRQSDKRRFEIVGYIPGGASEREYAERAGFGPLFPTLEGALEQVSIDEIVVALDERRGAFPAQTLLEQKFHGIKITDIIDFLEQELEKIDLSVMYPGWFIYESDGYSNPLHGTLKRIFDASISAFMLILLSPVFLCVALSIWIEDGIGAPILYRQRRVGRNHQIFDLLKFRSMVVNAESDTGARWASSDDDRITRTGNVLRRFRLDELPQLINVLMAEMSIVGPRPERPEFVDQISAAVPMYDYRHCVRPGITGWAQLNFPYGASVLDAREKLKYDLYYIKNADIIFDVFVLLQTLEVVIWGKATSMAGPSSENLDEVAARDRNVSPFDKRKRDAA